MAHNIVFHDGAETRDEVRCFASTGTVSNELTTVSYGRAAYRIATSSSGVSYKPSGLAANGSWSTTEKNHQWFTFHFYAVSLPSTISQVLVLLDATLAIRRLQVVLNSTGTFTIYNSGVAANSTTAGAIATGTWYVVSVYFNRNGTNQIVARNRDTGSTVATTTVAENSNNTIAESRIGPYSDAVNGADMIFDNIVFESSDTAANIDDPVNQLGTKYACGLLLPNGAGFYDQWTNDYTYVDEVPHDSGSTVRQETTINEVFTQAMTPTSGLAAQAGTIYAATAFSVEINDAGGTIILRLRSGTTDADTSAFGPGVSYVAQQRLFLTDPATAGSWTVSAIDSVEVGAKRATSSGTSTVTLIGLEVLYTITVVGRTRVIAYVMDDMDPMQRVLDGRTGEELPYEEVQPNVGWMRVTSGEMPDSASPSNAWEDDTLLPIDSVKYSQSASGVSLDIVPSAEGLGEQLIRGLANSAGSL